MLLCQSGFCGHSTALGYGFYALADGSTIHRSESSFILRCCPLMFQSVSGCAALEQCFYIDSLRTALHYGYTAGKACVHKQNANLETEFFNFEISIKVPLKTWGGTGGKKAYLLFLLVQTKYNVSLCLNVVPQ